MDLAAAAGEVADAEDWDCDEPTVGVALPCGFEQPAAEMLSANTTVTTAPSMDGNRRMVSPRIDGGVRRLPMPNVVRMSSAHTLRDECS